METQLELFDTTQYDVTPSLMNLRNSIRIGWPSFSVDKLQKASTLHKLSCEVVWKTFEEITKNERPCNHPDG